MTASTLAPVVPIAPESRAAGAPAIQVEALTKRYFSPPRIADLLRGRRGAVTTVVDHVNFEVAVGEIFGVLGPNGAGKTTLFKMLSTMVLPDDGTGRVCGHDIWAEPNRVCSVLAAVPSDERSLNWRLTARENLLLFAALHRVPRDEVVPLVDATLATVGLQSTATKMVAAFSSGMRQRLLIARALLARPRVLLLDEPTRGLDPISAEEFRTFLRKDLVGRQRCTIMLATHNADEALGFCDRVMVLNRGQALAIGTAAELKARFGEEHYRILTNAPNDSCFGRLEAAALIRRLPSRLDELDEWSVVECAIPGDPSKPAQVVDALVRNGVQVARLERVEPSLADLISRIIGDATKEMPRHA